MTYREIVYLILDELKGTSDDFTFNENHVIELCSKYRAFLLKQRYGTDIKKQIPESNYQTICLDLIESAPIIGDACEGGNYLKSVLPVPNVMTFSNSRVYPIDFYQGNIAFVSRDRMKFVGHNKYMSNIIYCSIGPDNHLYFKSSNPQFLYLERVKFTGIFEDAEGAAKLDCSKENDICDILDFNLPIEDALVPPLMELIVKELRAAIYMPTDELNDANDNMDEMNIKK